MASDSPETLATAPDPATDPQIPEVAQSLSESRYDLEYPYIPLSAMNPAPYNPREISDEALAALAHSLKNFGLVQPLVWNKRTGHLVGGHQRYKVLARDGVKEAKTCVVDLDETEEQMLNLTLNNPALQGEFNMKMLADLVKVLKSKKSAAEFKESGLQKLTEQLPLFDGVKETPHAGEAKTRITKSEAAEAKLEKADVKMLQLFYTSAQHKDVMNWIAVASEAFGTDNASDTVFQMLKGFAQNYGQTAPLVAAESKETEAAPAQPEAKQ